MVETKGFVPTPATLDAEVEGEIVQEDGTPVPPLSAAPSNPSKVRGGSPRGSQEYVTQSDVGLMVVLLSLEALGNGSVACVSVWLCVCQIGCGSLPWRVLSCAWAFVGVREVYNKVQQSVTLTC